MTKTTIDYDLGLRTMTRLCDYVTMWLCDYVTDYVILTLTMYDSDSDHDRDPTVTVTVTVTLKLLTSDYGLWLDSIDPMTLDSRPRLYQSMTID